MPQIDTEQLKEYAAVVFERTNTVNDYVLQTIGRRIKEIGELSAYDQQALKNIADISGDMAAITKKLAQITEMNIADIEAIYTKTVTDGVNSYKPLFDFRGMKFMPFEQNEYAQQLARHWVVETSKEMINLSRTKAIGFAKYDVYNNLIGFAPLEGAFQKAVDDAVIAVSTGIADFETARRETIKQLGGSGVRVNYGSGVTRRLDSMVRQNLLYGAKQSAQAYDEYIGEKLGCDGFEVDYHPNARPSHVFMGGKMFSYAADVTIEGITYPDGAEALARLDDYGCLHFKYDVILGVSQPRYDKAWLEEQKTKDAELIEYNGLKKTGYEWTKAQRRLETAVRAQTDIETMAKAAGDKSLERQAREKIDAYCKKYDDLCEKTGLQPTLERMAAVSGKPLTGGGNGGIIKEDRDITVRSMANGLRKPPMYILSDDEIKFLQEDIKAIGADESVFLFNSGHQTSYIDKYDKIFVRGDVLPDLSSQHPRDLMSSRAVLAHEYYGHRAYSGTKLKVGSWNDEFRASYMAAKNCPNLNEEDRRYLVLDALERAKESGITIKNNDFIRRILYGY